MSIEFDHEVATAEGGWFRAYDHGWCDAPGVVAGLRDVFESKGERTVTFVAADHHASGRRVYQTATIGLGTINGEPIWRYCGADGDPMGPGSHTLHKSTELAEAATQLALAMTKGHPSETTLFRQPSKRIIGWELDGSICR